MICDFFFRSIWYTDLFCLIYFRYGRVQSVKLLSRSDSRTDGGGGREGAGGEEGQRDGGGSLACTVAFMDIKSASKAHTAEHKIEERILTTEYYEPQAVPKDTPQGNTGPQNTSGQTQDRRFNNSHR